MRLRTARFYQFVQAAFPIAFTCDQALNTSHFTESLNAVLVALCWAGHKYSSQQQGTVICVLNQPTNLPSSSRRKKNLVRAVKLDPRWYGIRKPVRSGLAWRKTRKWRGPRGGRRWTGRREG